jgi:AhpD family alkylhydroperoxidase
MQHRIHEIDSLLSTLRATHPNEVQAFMNFMGKAEAGPALTLKEKELVNVALSVAAQCEWCIALHTKNALHAGATRDQLVEAGFQAVLMHGGPALMYMTPLLEAIGEFTETVRLAAPH